MIVAMSRCIPALFLLFYFALPNNASGFDRWSNWQSSALDSLSDLDSSTISTIFREQNGRTYIATAEAIYSFDGEELTELQVHWATNDGYPIDRVLGFAGNQNSTVYAYTVQDGLYLKTVDSDEFRALDGRDGWRVGEPVLAAVNVSSPNGILNLVNGRVFYFDFLSQKSVLVSSSPENRDIVGIGILPDDRVSTLTNDGWITFYTWNTSGGWRVQDRVACSAENLPTGKYSTLDGKQFYGSGPGDTLAAFNIEMPECKPRDGFEDLELRLRGAKIREVQRFPKSEYLTFSTDKGLFIYQDGATSVLTTDNSILRSNQITTVAEVFNEELMVGSYLGLIGAHKGNVIVVTRLSSETRPEVTSISSLSEKIFVSTFRGLYKIEQDNQEIISSEIHLPHVSSGLSVLEVVGRTLFIGTTAGRILGLNADSLTLQCTADTQESAPITGLVASKDLTRVFASSLTGVIVTIDDCIANRPAKIKTFLKQESAIIGLKRLKDQIFVTDFEGIRSLPETIFENADLNAHDEVFAPTSVHPNVWSFSDLGGSVLFGSPKGELSFKASLYAGQAFKVRQIPDTPYAVETDGLGRAWLSSKRGLWVGSEESEFKLALRAKEMNSIAFEFNASHRTSNGALLFGGNGGVVVIKSPSAIPRQRLGTLSLKYASVGRQTFRSPVPSHSIEVLIPNVSENISFKFRAPFTIGRSYDRVETKLLPNDTNWTRHNSLGPVTIGPLLPGNYTFRARGANSLGVWSENEISIPIKVLPPVWRSWWAVMLYLIAAVVIALLLKRSYGQRVVRAARLAHGEEAARAFVRLEDEWQEQREATDHLLRSIPATVSTIIQTARAVVASQGLPVRTPENEPSVPDVLSAIDNRLLALQQQQALCVLSTASQTCNAQQLVDEMTTLVVGRARYGSRYIVLNETPELPLAARQGQSIAIVLADLLELMVSREPAPDVTDPIIHVRIEHTTDKLRIVVADKDAVRPSDALVDEALAATLTLIESLGGSIAENTDFGYEVEITLPELEADTR